jgi:hypothetical protein
MRTKKELYKIRLDHYKWLISKGIKTTFESVCKFQKTNIKSKSGELDLSHLKVKNSIPCSNNIGGSTAKRVYATQLPAGKTISVAYNKGPYMIVDAKDFKTMGRKV